MESYDQALAAWKQAWQMAPTAPPLVETPLSTDDEAKVMRLVEQSSARIPPTPLPRPFQTPIRIEMIPFYPDPLSQLAQRGEQGVLYRFFRPSSVSTEIHWLQPGETFAGWFFFGHYTYPPPPEAAQGQDFRLLCLLDYRQVSFRLDGVESDRHDFHMGPNEERAFWIEFSGIPQGAHFLACIFYFDPDAFPGLEWDEASYDDWLDRTFQANTLFLGHLFVGEESMPETSYALLPGSLSAQSDLSGLIMVNLSGAEEDAWRCPWPATRDGGELIAWGLAEVSPGEQVNLVLRANNDDAVPFRFGVAAFLDYRQVPLRVQDREPVSWYELPPGRQEVIPLSFWAPQEPGPHIYFIVEFQNPYRPDLMYEWAGDVIRFPWIPLLTEDGTVYSLPVSNIHQATVSAFHFRIPLLVKGE